MLKMRFALRQIVCFLAAAIFSACGLIDDDMRDCETDYNLDYELRLVTNMTTELQTQLSMATDIHIAHALQAYLGDVFTDHAHDVDLSFYNVEQDPVTGDSLRLHHESHIMDATQSSYTLYIPIRRYMHTAVANIEENSQVTLENGGLCHAARLHQEDGDTVGVHKTGLFTARLPMNIKEGEDQQFDVRLFMANCASSLVVDTLGSGIRDMRVYMSGFATDFNICDSLYRFSYTPVVRTEKLELEEPGQLCFTCVSFPSRSVPDTKVVIESPDSFVTDGAEQGLWQVRIYAYLKDGTVTETIFQVHHPLLAGQLRVIKAKAFSDGSLAPGDPTVGVSVTLEWEEGMEHVVPL